MSFLTTLISSFLLLSYSVHHITLSSSHFHTHLISSHHTSHHHSHCLLSHRIHLFILTTFHAFFHHLICITLITSHIHLSFISHPPHSILLLFHHFRIFHFSTHPFHHGALRDFLKTHFLLFFLIILSYSLFHTPFHPISPPSPSSPLISALPSHSLLWSLFIHFHPFPSHYSFQSLQSHSLFSISIPILSFHSISSFPFIYMSLFDSSFLRVQ